MAATRSSVVASAARNRAFERPSYASVALIEDADAPGTWAPGWAIPRPRDLAVYLAHMSVAGAIIRLGTRAVPQRSALTDGAAGAEESSNDEIPDLVPR
jgi:hypothetical protein